MELTPGQQLRQAREARGLSIAQAANATHIRPHYLEALETDTLERLPSLAQGRGLLRAYAQYLSLEPDELLQRAAAAAPGEAAAPARLDAPPGHDVVNQAQSIFREIGDKLRRQRELIGLSIEDVERHTHLRGHFLQAIEAGQIERLPSSVQGRGMISNYATFLGFDPDPILLRFADGLQASLAARKGPRTAMPTQNSPDRLPWRMRLFSADLLLAGLVLVLLLAFIIWAAQRVIEAGSQQQASQTAPSVAEVLAPDTPSPAQGQPSPTLEFTPAGGAATQAPLQVQPTAGGELSPTPTQDALNQAAVQIYVVVRQRAYLRVTADGKVVFEGRVAPGAAYLYSGNERVEILTGNGAAIQLFYNRTDLGAMGILGQVVERVFTPEGVETPTPTPTPQGLPSATPTLAPTQTPTITPTPTLRP